MTINNNGNENEVIKKVYTCKKCHNTFCYEPDEVKWYEFGTYSDKTITCPECGCVNSIKYVDAPGLYVNTNARYY